MFIPLAKATRASITASLRCIRRKRLRRKVNGEILGR
jgi:hypothetical protein